MSAHVVVENLSLDMPVWVQPAGVNRNWVKILIKAAFEPPKRSRRRVLDGISFHVRDGERVGLLGVNGAGKSTLLRVLNGVYVPSSGGITINGSRQALLNLSLGFNNEATIAENIFLRGTAMGMKTSLIRELVNPILVFSGLEDRVSHRLHTLSAGQRLRLGFSISTAIQHDIILMDEWVGTGDTQFMAKAKERLLNRVEGSKIVFLASHSLGLLQDVCTRGFVLEQGRLVFDGDIKDAIEAHQYIAARTSIARNQSGEYVKTIGALDSISFKNKQLILKGWALQEFISIPPLLVLEVNGHRHSITNFKLQSRNDVQKKFGLSNPLCGFEAEIEISGCFDNVKSIGLYGGYALDALDGPFRMSHDLMRKLKGGVPFL